MMDTLEATRAQVQRTLSVTSGFTVDLPTLPVGPDRLSSTDAWKLVVVSAIHTANKRLRSIELLLNPEVDDTFGAVVLTRSLFECAVVLKYIYTDIELHLPKYLDHQGFPRSQEEWRGLVRKFEENHGFLAPSSTWKSPGKMRQGNWVGIRIHARLSFIL